MKDAKFQHPKSKRGFPNLPYATCIFPLTVIIGYIYTAFFKTFGHFTNVFYFPGLRPCRRRTQHMYSIIKLTILLGVNSYNQKKHPNPPPKDTAKVENNSIPKVPPKDESIQNSEVLKVSKFDEESCMESQLLCTKPQPLNTELQFDSQLKSQILSENDGKETQHNDKSTTEPQVAKSTFLYEQLTSSVFESLEFVKCLGQGAYGKVYLVKSKSGSKLDFDKAALKIQTLDLESSTLLSLKTIIANECEILSQLSSKNIARLYSAVEAESRYLMLLEYVEGVELKDIIDAVRKVPSEQIRLISRQILNGLEEVRKAGAIFADLKPENVMVDVNGVVKIVDFGCGRFTNENDVYDGGLIPDDVLGSANYMSPELIDFNYNSSGEGIGFSTDYWSLGCLIYQMAQTNPPFNAMDRQTIYKNVQAVIYFPNIRTDQSLIKSKTNH